MDAAVLNDGRISASPILLPYQIDANQGGVGARLFNRSMTNAQGVYSTCCVVQKST